MNRKNITLLIVLLVIIGAIWFLQSKKPMRDNVVGENISTTSTPTDSQTAARIASKVDKYPGAVEFQDIQGYINSKPFTLKSLIGKKVILLDFWTYSCINCIRTLPYLENWYAKYKDQGLEIVGVHTPEFDFEKNYDNVAAAVKKDGILYPVVLDSNYGTWNAYENSYWPREYLIDIDGFVVHDQIGEGNYDETEAAIQKALTQRAEVLGEKTQINTTISTPKNVITMDEDKVSSPETYFGLERNQYVSKYQKGVDGSYIANDTSPELNFPYLGGHWDLQNEYALSQGDGEIVYKYNAKNVYFVASSDTGVSVQIYLDGKLIDKNFAGDDVINGKVNIKENRLYSIVKGMDYGEHVLEIRTPAGLKAFTFTFG